jgi:glucosamine--fructose-6-phosphate aminotransferase (isomerizing)
MTNSYAMLDYIYQSPEALNRTLSSNEANIERIANRVSKRNIKRIVISGVGSSYTAGLIAAPVFMRFCSLPTYFLPSTEIEAYQPGLIDENTLIVAVSRSGERGWVVDSFCQAVRKGAMGIAITGNPEGLLAQNAPELLVSREGPEASFPKTKSVVAHAGILARLALAMADSTDPATAIILKALYELPKLINNTLKACEPQVQALMPELKKYRKMMLAGTLGNYGVALEGSLKMQEASGLVVVGNETGNMLHGPWGTITPDWLITLLVTEFDRTLSEVNLRLAKKIGAKRMGIVEAGISLGSLVDYEITIPFKSDRFLAGMVFLPPIQLLTYYWAIANALDPDTPANVSAVLEAMLPDGRQEPEMNISNFPK